MTVTTFRFGERLNAHHVTDTACPACWLAWPQPCTCGGLIHAEFYEEHGDGYELSHACDQCGADYTYPVALRWREAVLSFTDAEWAYLQRRHENPMTSNQRTPCPPDCPSDFGTENIRRVTEQIRNRLPFWVEGTTLQWDRDSDPIPDPDTLIKGAFWVHGDRLYYVDEHHTLRALIGHRATYPHRWWRRLWGWVQRRIGNHARTNIDPEYMNLTLDQWSPIRTEPDDEDHGVHPD